MTPKASNPFSAIDAWFKDYDSSTCIDNAFELLVAVCGRVESPGPRNDMWEYILDVGKEKIKAVLALEPIGAGTHYFIFPDRWMQPAESAGFRDRLLKNPDAKKFKRVYVVVNQPYIVSGCKKEQIRTITNNNATC